MARIWTFLMRSIHELGRTIGQLDKWIPSALCAVVTAFQVCVVVRLVASLRSRARRSAPQEFIFDVGALVFLTGMQALLVHSILKSYVRTSWISGLIIAGIVIVVCAISLNVVSLARKK